jgi:subtilisin-like proprotein convertase family protein
MTEELELINPRQYPHYNEVTLAVQENMDGDYPDGEVDLIIEDRRGGKLITLNKDQVKQLKDWLDK